MVAGWPWWATMLTWGGVVGLSAGWVRVGVGVFSTDAGGPERGGAGQGCYPGVRAAGRGGEPSQALR